MKKKHNKKIGEKKPADVTAPQTMETVRNDKKLVLIFSFILVFATFFAYSSSVVNNFVWDDRNFIIENPFVHNLSYWREAFIHNIGYSGGARNNFYRPLYTLSNMFDYALGGGRPFLFHITNMMLHAACAVTVLILIVLLCSNIFIAFAAALLFAVHPVQTEAVTYISGRADSLYLFFLLLALIAFIVHTRIRKNSALYAVSIISFIFSLLSKEGGLITPFLILLYIYTFPEAPGEPDKRKWAGIIIPYFVVLAIYLLLRVTVLDFSKTAYATLVVSVAPFFVRLLTACKAILIYLKFLFIPVGFQMEMHLPMSRSLIEPETFLAVVGVACLITALVWVRKRNKFIFFGLAWFFIGLIPVLNLFPVNAVMAIHWLYLPSIGFFFVISSIMWDLIRLPFKEQKACAYGFVALFLIIGSIFGILTFEKNKEWKNEETLYKHILPISQTPRVYVNLGNIFVRKNQFDKAIECYLKALAIAPGQTEAYINLGYIYNAQGQFAKSEEVLKKAIDLSPQHANGYLNLAATYANMGRYNDALALTRKALELNPNNATAYNIMGEIYLRMGNNTEAAKMFNQSLAIQGDQPEIRKKIEKWGST